MISLPGKLNFKKRERTQNWTIQEKNVLYALIKENVKVIESKTATPSQKAKTWRTVHLKFNQICPTKRDLERIKEQWRRMKGYAKLEMTAYNNKIKQIGFKQASKDQPSKLALLIWRLCLESKQSRKESEEDSENMDTVDNSNFINYEDSLHLHELSDKSSTLEHEEDTATVKIKIENEIDVTSNNEEIEDKDNDETMDFDEYNNENKLNKIKLRKKKFDLTGRINGDITEEIIRRTEDNIVPNSVNLESQRIYVCENSQQKSTFHLDTNHIEQNLRIELLKTQLEYARLQRETAINELKTSAVRRQIVENEAEEKLKSQVKMIGERGSGAGKGGGGGGSIREAGGSFGKMEAAKEDQYFYNMQKEQLSKIREGLHDEISFHEEQIKRHQEAINRHKKRINEMDKE